MGFRAAREILLLADAAQFSIVDFGGTGIEDENQWDGVGQYHNKPDQGGDDHEQIHMTHGIVSTCGQAFLSGQCRKARKRQWRRTRAGILVQT